MCIYACYILISAQMHGYIVDWQHLPKPTEGQSLVGWQVETTGLIRSDAQYLLSLCLAYDSSWSIQGRCVAEDFVLGMKTERFTY